MGFEGPKKQKRCQANLILASDVFKRNNRVKRFQKLDLEFDLLSYTAASQARAAQSQLASNCWIEF